VQTDEANLERALHQQQQVGRAGRVLVRSVVLVCAASMLSLDCGRWQRRGRSLAGSHFPRTTSTSSTMPEPFRSG
jgi:hypothetical protein